jgi:hypothetical protein
LLTEDSRELLFASGFGPPVCPLQPQVDSIRSIFVIAADLRRIRFDLVADEFRRLGVRSGRKFFIVGKGMRGVPQGRRGVLEPILADAGAGKFQCQFRLQQGRPVIRDLRRRSLRAAGNDDSEQKKQNTHKKTMRRPAQPSMSACAVMGGRNQTPPSRGALYRPPSRKQTDDEQRDEDEEQDLGNSRCGDGDSAEPEDRGNNCQYEKNPCV